MLIHRHTRIWRGTTTTGGIVPASESNPGVAIIDFVVPWTAEQVALQASGQLCYLGIIDAHVQAIETPLAYPSGLAVTHAWKPESGSPSMTDLDNMPVCPLNLGGDYTFDARGAIHFLHTPSYKVNPMGVGNHHSLVGISTGAGQNVALNYCSFTLIEFLTGLSQVYTADGLYAPV